jgi:chromosome segregation ATPase
MRFNQQRAAFVQTTREKSNALIEEREQVSRDLAEEQEKIAAMKAKQQADEPKCEQLRQENGALTEQMIAIKEVQGQTAAEAEDLRNHKHDLLKRKVRESSLQSLHLFPFTLLNEFQEALNGEIAAVSDVINRTRSRIVQSPERIKRTISVMGDTAVEDKKTVAMLDAKARDLQAKITALLNIEKVRPFRCATLVSHFDHTASRISGRVWNSSRQQKRKFEHWRQLKRSLPLNEIILTKKPSSAVSSTLSRKCVSNRTRPLYFRAHI